MRIKRRCFYVFTARFGKRVPGAGIADTNNTDVNRLNLSFSMAILSYCFVAKENITTSATTMQTMTRIIIMEHPSFEKSLPRFILLYNGNRDPGVS